MLTAREQHTSPQLGRTELRYALLVEADLTYPLPETVQAAGWCVSKVIPLCLQPLVTEEDAPWAASRRLSGLTGPPQPLL
jgi:hypothetical protein